jgi:hypothetical protein
VVVDDFGQLLHRVLVLLGVRTRALEHGEQGFMALGVLLFAVLRFVGVDIGLAA